jgi:hypothetical protein
MPSGNWTTSSLPTIVPRTLEEKLLPRSRRVARDPHKLMKLIAEITRLLEEKKVRLE